MRFKVFLVIVLTIMINYSFAQKFIYKADSVVTLTYSKKTYHTDKCNIVITNNLQTSRIIVYTPKPSYYDFIKFNESNDTLGLTILKYTAIDDKGEQCNISLYLGKNEDQYNSHDGMLQILYSDRAKIYQFYRQEGVVDNNIDALDKIEWIYTTATEDCSIYIKSEYVTHNRSVTKI